MDRAIILELTRISTKGRKQETRFLEAFRGDLPDILGGILDVMVMVIARRHEQLEEYPRLADWYGLGYIAADVLGVREDFVTAYKDTEKRQHREVVESHVVSMLLMEFMEEKNNWYGTKNEIYAILSAMAEEKKIKKSWPKTCNTFGKQLKRLYHNLEEMGFDCEDDTDGEKRKFSISRKAPSESKGDDDRHFRDLREGSGSVVSVVSAVISPDISDIHLTTDGISVVSGVVSVVSLNEKEGQSSEVPVEYIHFMPEEVQGWSDFLQEDFCIHVEWNREEGMSWEEADRLAIEHVKSTPDYLARGPHVY
jgi:hypothetical protein